MTFKEWFYSVSHRAKYTTDHPAYLAAQEAWEAAHEACAKVCDEIRHPWGFSAETSEWCRGTEHCAEAIRAMGNQNDLHD